MHGSPLLRTVWILVALLLAGVPMWRMTHESAAAVVAPVTAAGAKESEVHLEVAFAERPVRFEVDYLGKAIWEEAPVNALTESKDVGMIYPKEGVDLEYKVTWAPGTPLTAARLAVAANDAEPVEKTLWGTGNVDDVLSFP
jgi:hypothetical protein